MTYWAILEKVRGSQLRLTKMDDEIYESFMKEFPDFDPAETLNEDTMKSKEGKEKWRNWMNQYEKTVTDFNFGTMLRSNPKFEYDQETTIFGGFSFLTIGSLFALGGYVGLTSQNSHAHAVLRDRDRQVSIIALWIRKKHKWN